MKVLIIGLGSIAKKHIHALQSLQKEIHFTALRNSNKSPSYEQVTDVFSLEAVDLQSFDFFLISSPTHLHFRHLEQLLPLNKPIFLEKSIVNSARMPWIQKEFENSFQITE